MLLGTSSEAVHSTSRFEAVPLRMHGFCTLVRSPGWGPARKAHTGTSLPGKRPEGVTRREWRGELGLGWAVAPQKSRSSQHDDVSVPAAQPQAPVVAATIVAQPAVPAGPPLKTGDFLDGWSNCFNDCNSCCLAWCCPCFSYAKIVSSLREEVRRCCCGGGAGCRAGASRCSCVCEMRMRGVRAVATARGR